MKYDVIVVGAGIPGLYTARELIKAGKKVAVIEKNKSPYTNNYSTAGIPFDTLNLFKLSKGAINSEIKNYIYATAKEEVFIEGSKTQAYVLDFARTKELLIEEILSIGGNVYWNEEYVSLLMYGNKVERIFTRSMEFEADYFIDASGFSRKLLNDFDFPQNNEKVWSGIEYIVSDIGLSKYEETISFCFDKNLAPFGYGWVFDNGESTYKIGLCEYNANLKRDLPPLNKRLDNFFKHLGLEKQIKIIEKHGGMKKISKLPKTVYKGNVLGVGDSINAINPFMFEGIKQGLYSGKFATEAILNGNLSAYRENWLKYNGIRRKMSEIASYFLYKNPNNKLFDLFVDTIKKQKITTDELSEIGFNYKFEKAVKKDLLLPIKILRNVF